MSASAVRGAPAIETLGPLTLTRRRDGPWLAIRHGDTAEITSLVIAGDPRAPKLWRRIDADQPVETGNIETARLTPLSDFAVLCSLYPHSRVLSVWMGGISRAKRFGHTAGGHWPWEGARCDRIKVPRNLWDLVAAAAKDCNTIGPAPARLISEDDLHDLTVGAVRGG
jgi:hypothetical protein